MVVTTLRQGIAVRQTYRSMERKRKSENRPTQKQPIDFQQRCQWRKDSLFNKRCHNYPEKRIYKNQLEMDHRYIHKT